MLLRDLLDKKLTDRKGREMGRVDRIVLHVAVGEPPRVVAVAVGPSVLAPRLNAAVRRCVEGLLHACLIRLRTGGYVAAWHQVDITDPDRPRLTCPVEGLRSLESSLTAAGKGFRTLGSA